MVCKKILAVSLLAISIVAIPFQASAHAVATLPEEHDHIEEMISHIDDQIRSMSRLKNYYMAKSVRYRNRATRIRYQDPTQMRDESEKLAKQADEYDKIVKKLNMEIAKLESQRRRLEKKIS